MLCGLLPIRASCPCCASCVLLFFGRLLRYLFLVHGILSCTLLWRCSSQSFATSHGLLGSSPTLCPSASPRPLTCIYTAGHPTLQSTSAIAGIITPPVFLHFDSMTPCSYSLCRLLRFFTLLRSPLAIKLLVASCLFGPLALVLVVVGPLALQ